MLDTLTGNGKLEKMIVRAFRPQTTAGEKAELSTDEADKYVVQVNPESYQINYQVNYDHRPAQGNSGSQAKYASTSPPTLEFDFLFDGTGVIPAAAGPLDNVPIAGAIADLVSGDGEYDVMAELNKFMQVVYDFQDEEHRPRRIQLTWGKLIFEGVLSGLQLNYKLFKPDGTPLRAEAKATFDGSISDVFRELAEKKNSPDLTHLRQVVSEDTLPLMAHRIYGESRRYLEVARHNQLYDFRRLRAGRELTFPPLDKKAQ